MTVHDRDRPVHVGLVLDDFSGLAGARDFLISLVDGLRKAEPEWRYTFIYRLPPSVWTLPGLKAMIRNIAKRLLRGRASSQNVDHDVLMQQLMRDGLDTNNIRTIRSNQLSSLALKEGMDVLLPFAAALPSSFPVPWVGYLYDFQHIYISNLFTSREINWREESIRSMLNDALSVVVNSRSVAEDAKNWVGRSRAQVFALPFSAAPAPDWFKKDPKKVQEQYGLDPRYFMISNQFWVHKKHDVAFKAFAVLAQQHPDLQLVCTGATEDGRAPGHLPMLKNLISGHGLNDHIRLLGLIPKLDQIALMRGAIGVIQPTAFEGGPGGGSVFDAIALGVPTIVSDIPINREIEDLVDTYVPLADCDALASAMKEMMVRPRRAILAEQQFAEGDARRERMGGVVATAALYAIAAHGKQR